MHSRSKFTTFNTPLNGTAVGETIKTTDLDGVYARTNTYTKQYGIDAGAGNDTVSGGYSDDEIRAGAGDDVVSGSYGWNQLFGGAGIDTISFADFGLNGKIQAVSGVNVSLQEGTKLGNASSRESQFIVYDEFTEFENVRGSEFGDVIFGNDEGNNQLFGLAGQDQLAGKRGDDYLAGGLGNDTLFGGFGNDRVVGGKGRDTLDGGVDNDVLVGGKGRDIQIGQSGNDTYDYNKLSDSTNSRTGRDFISFKTGEDKIDLRTIDAIKGTKKNDQFDLIGRAEKFSGKKGELKFDYVSGLSIDGTLTITNTLIKGDVNGDKKADFAILIEGIRGLKDADFYL